MLKQPNLTDDLFEKSSMSFGEHLEELRKALAKAFVWLALGTGIGLFFANSVVEFISKPLREELDVFYLKQTAAKFRSVNSVEPPADLLAWMREHSVMPERVFIDPTQLVFHPAEEASADSPAEARTAAPVQANPISAPSTAGVGSTATTDSKAGADSNVAGSEVANRAAANKPRVEPGKDDNGPGNEDKELIKQDKETSKENRVWRQLSSGSVARMEPLLIMRPIPNRLSTFDSLEGFLIWLKAGLLVGATIASPGIFWHIWEFLAAGLYPHERRYVYLYLPLSVILFVAGVSLAFFVIFELVINFLLTYNEGMDIDFTPRLKDYISFALFLPLGFGIAFQLPIVMLGLNRFGIISVELYISKWRIAVLAIAFLSMILTPADAYSMIGMFVPLTLLYFLGILLCKYLPKGPGLGSQAFDPT
jgi:sec-independent protein translocase protein TatC